MLGHALLQLRMLAARGTIERDPEELFNAGQAWLALHGDLGWLFAMQYRPFCGGCTVHAVTAMGLFTVLPPVEGVYKLIPLAWSLAGLGLSWALLDRHRGRPGARMAAALWLLAPPTWAHLQLIGWGHHAEAGVAVLGAAVALAAGRPGLAGLVLGAGTYLSFSAGFGAVAVVGLLALRRRWGALARVLAGLPLGLAGWGLQLGLAGEHPFHTIYAADESVPDPRRLPGELWTLLAPRQLAGLFGAGPPALRALLGPAVGISGLGAAAACLRARPGPGPLLGALGLAFLGVYGLTDFSVKVAEAGVMYPGGLRYAAPLFGVLALALAWQAAGLWGRGRRVAAAALLLPWLGAGALGRVAVLQTPTDTARLARAAVDWRYVRERLSYVFDGPAHTRGARSPDPWTAALHRYGLGREGLAEDPREWSDSRHFQEGLGEAALRVQPGGAVPPALADLSGIAAEAGLARIWDTIDPAAWERPLADDHPARAWATGHATGQRRAADPPGAPSRRRCPRASMPPGPPPGPTGSALASARRAAPQPAPGRWWASTRPSARPSGPPARGGSPGSGPSPRSTPERPGTQRRAGRSQGSSRSSRGSSA